MADITTKYKSAFTGAEIDEGVVLARNAVPLDGSKAMTGALNFRIVYNGSSRLQKSHSDTADYGTILRDYDKDGNLLSLVIRAALGIVGVSGNDGLMKEILHTGNKPSGSYTGNGSAAARTIDTGGIGKVMIIWSNTNTTIAVVTHNAGALCKTETTVKALKNSACAISANGALALVTDDITLNANGVTYNYQVL